MKNFLILLLSIILLTGCQGKHDEALAWIAQLPVGMPQAEVRAKQPSFMKIGWDHAIVSGATKRFEVTEIEGFQNLQSERLFLVFDADSRFQGQAVRK
jgi:hypothetical protein